MKHLPTSLRLAAWAAICGVSMAALLHAETFPGNGLATADGKPDIRFDFLEPGFTVRELPVRVSNLNNIEYARDGRLFAVGYDGRVHVLRDTDGDGQEDTATLFWQGKGDYEMPLGLVVRDDSVYVTLRRRIERLRDTDGDGVADQNEVVATGWHEEITQTDKTFLHRRVDDAIGLAMDPQGNFYTSLGCANYQNLYQVDAEGKSRYSRERFRGSVVKVAPGGKPEIVATGVRFLVSMQFNKAGDLFATDQEGATWGPGNPFDELLHLQRGRHYGFPPRHSEYLPDVFDEPSVVDFGPQHQSTCGFRFDEEREGFRRFGPKEWEGNAIVTGESRGKLWRVPLVRTRDGYAGKPVLIGSTNMMPIDVTIAPNGDLLVCCHGGIPDWGTGPKGEGRIFRISHTAPQEPRLAAVWPSGLTEVKAAFTETLPKDATFDVEIIGGRYVRAGDDVETFRPGYGVVKGQQAQAPRHRVVVTGSRLSEDGRSVIVTTSAHPWVGNYGMMLRWKSAGSGRSGTVRGDYDFHGISVSWTRSGGTEPSWNGWLPHANLDVARAWTLGSGEHDALFAHFREPGTLRIKGTFDSVPEEVAISLETTAKGNWDWNGHAAVLSEGKASVQKLAEVAQPFAVELGTYITLPMSLTFTQRVTADRGQKLRTAAPGPLSRSAVLLPGAPALPAPDAPPKPKESPAFVRGDLEKGRQAFTTTCAICHSFRGQGAKVGPDLSNSPERDASGLLEDIVKPSATLNPDYIGYELVLKNDTTVVGSIASDRPGRFLVQQPGGALIEVQQADIKTMRQLPTSLMPAGFEGLGEETLRNIITYLITPAGE